MVMQGGFGCVEFFLVPGIHVLLRTLPHLIGVEVSEQSVSQIDDHLQFIKSWNRTRSTEEQDKVAPSKGHFLNNCLLIHSECFVEYLACFFSHFYIFYNTKFYF